ncbi:MAG: MarR family transcriptional regulator [Aeromicrobium erythreum]
MEQPDRARGARALRDLTVLLTRVSPRAGLSRTAAGTLGRLAAQGPTRITDLAVQESASQPAMTGLVKRLEAAGHVVREADPDDGRATRIALTPSGRQALDERRAAVDAALRDLIDRLSPDHQSSLLAAVPAIEELVQITEDHAHA